ncbi:MAG: Uma2 family endonuclease [Acidobacteriales bacterium]|nr:Uma2 family endonuclease [Terriglobales bacterium]
MVEMVSTSPLNPVITSRIGYFLNGFVLPNELGFVTAPHGGFKLKTGRVRQPDCAFISNQRVADLPPEFDMAPDLAVAVVAPNEDVLKQVDEYLEAGTQLVWVIYPQERSVHRFRQVEPRWQKLSLDDTLDGEAVLPGFRLPVSDSFPRQKSAANASWQRHLNNSTSPAQRLPWHP